MTCGIYQILNTVTDKCYVGSSIDIRNRWKQHNKNLRHLNHHSIKLQRAWNKYGPDVWEWNILQECEESRLVELESFWQAKLNSYHSGYDSTLITFENGKAIRRHSEETKARLRKPKSEETKLKMSLAAKNRVVSEETREKHRNKVVSEETREKCRKKTISEETRKKISIASKNQSRESREKQANALKGRKYSEEHKRKIGDSQRGKIVSQETREKLSLAKRLLNIKRGFN
jgi:group I intron endonuclease